MEFEFRLCVIVLLNAAVAWLYGAPHFVGLAASAVVLTIMGIGAVKVMLERREGRS